MQNESALLTAMETLKDIHETTYVSTDSTLYGGICQGIESLLLQNGVDYKHHSLIFHKFRMLYKKWPHFSGSSSYPVPYEEISIGSRDKRAVQAAIAYMDHFNELWDKSTEYGRLRWDLLEFCIAELTKVQITRRLLTALNHIDSNLDSMNNDCGICTEVMSLLNEQHPEYTGKTIAKLYRLFEEWPKYSGERGYPVPAPSSVNKTAPDMFMSASAEEMWDYKNYEYAKSRVELLRFCIATLEKELEAS